MDKIYTKTGDKGETSLLGGNRVPKFHPRVEAYGDIDELNSFIGFLRSQLDLTKEIKSEQRTTINDILINIQHHLYYLGSLIACDSCKEQQKLTQINESDITYLENEIDKIVKELPELKAFIIPAGNAAISACHICRTVCRRAERAVIQLSSRTFIDELIIIYLNRLSDYLFTLARKITKESGIEEQKYN